MPAKPENLISFKANEFDEEEKVDHMDKYFEIKPNKYYRARRQ